MASNEILTLFEEKAKAVQTLVAGVKNLDEAFRYAIRVTAAQGGKVVAAPGFGADELAALEKIGAEEGISVLGEGLRAHIGGFHTGLTRADWGIAETATLVLASSAEDMRLATTLSETHVAILPGSRVRREASELEGELSALMKSAPSFVAFVSGASRTADIERVLTIGVHGPQELHVLLMEADNDD